MSYEKINSFCLSQDERFCIAADNSGQIHTLSISDLSLVSKIRGHTGEINAICAHPRYPWIASLGEDRRVAIWTIDSSGHLHLRFSYSLRGHIASNSTKHFPALQSTSQALSFHPEKPWVLSRTAGSTVLETDVSADQPRFLRCYVADENWDIATARYNGNSDEVLVTSVRGTVYLMKDAQHIRQWQIDTETVHWLEEMPDHSYVLASDSRKVVRLDPRKDEIVQIGPVFARDDFEHITRCHKTGRLFAASFDRNIYEINPETLAPKSIVFKAPFKMRWIKVLSENSNHMLVQCRNGAVYKIDCETGKILNSYKKTPDALWSGVQINRDQVIFAGEGEYLVHSKVVDASDLFQQRSAFSMHRINLEGLIPSYTKRIAHCASSSDIALGRTSGEVVLVRKSGDTSVLNLGSAVRDLEFSSDGQLLFACTEAGFAFRIETASMKIVDRLEARQPIWSLALSPDNKTLACGERMGSLFFIQANDFRKFSEFKDITRIPKRMKWMTATKLLYTHSNELHEFDLENQKSAVAFVGMKNTVEDFFWTEDCRYLVAQTYHRQIFLYDFSTREMLWVCTDQMDYSKGLLPLTGSVYPYEFVTIGRMGVPMLYQIFEEKFQAVGRADLYLEGYSR